MDTGKYVDLGSTVLQSEPVAVQKAKRDVEILKLHARFAICLDGRGGCQVLESHPDYADTIPLIVVVGKVCTKGVWHEASLLEVGYRHTRPYRRFHEGNRVILYDRRPFFELGEEYYQMIYFELLRCLEVVLEETLSGRKSTDPWCIPGGRIIERGFKITVSKHDTWLYKTVLRDETQHFSKQFSRRFADVISSKLAGYKNWYHKYPKRVREVVDCIKFSGYGNNPRRLEALLRLLPATQRALIENALVSLHGFRNEFDEDARLVFGDARARLLSGSHSLTFYHTLRQPDEKKRGGHAKGCARFWVAFDPTRKPKIKKAFKPVPGFERVRVENDERPPF